MRGEGKDMKKIVTALLAIVAIIVAIVFSAKIYTPNDAKSQYFCDRKLFSFDMRVSVEDMSGNHKYTIDGEVLAAYEDDLAMTNSNGDVVRNTNDQFNFISQNQHDIYNGDELLYVCDGKIKWFADSYDVFDKDSNKIAHVDFNMWDTRGTMKDMDGNVIARYNSSMFRKDYIVSIYDGCQIDDESVLMIFASYVSDVRSDTE